MIQRPVRVLGGPAVRAASGGHPRLAWLPPRAMPQTSESSGSASPGTRHSVQSVSSGRRPAMLLTVVGAQLHPERGMSGDPLPWNLPVKVASASTRKDQRCLTRCRLGTSRGCATSSCWSTNSRRPPPRPRRWPPRHPRPTRRQAPSARPGGRPRLPPTTPLPLRVPAAAEPRPGPDRLASPVRRLPVPGLHQRPPP